ncbi:acetylornithine deacetylase/succinyl-diaminopimelate desuccinylase family protein [Sulfitobacter pseudonitzschiae]|uniref:Acetylornithine deacetylase/succinyl-diaminopimelate desuccinylase family protein n=1 Tax=Pseudosulfitobacter pseudonitzschiae TaxID=1402135 RepID=A0A9Q2NGN7_9RHOB|nr:acetylornithine deacetylase/succinyl-diaminopimelate desuccinylase family protein [Pseudosulfitobacter pseudonitzschiae]MBM2290695.1 acetylornithine deacetylase/succinyl-diaminopimelate desuccinylase family protein [Pseudosulfitobacter pseudonitzschiae]MBM2295613.1 acetylornithine deacetylase/succinyl-diaminopimelate desuccinylase family protein [Pseudosulfitobacter pseudonitzschiae]MBM2300525.1 acetylornithine deacetylase/succinyl-diaminopimelate desuccinylase family protein [Pseudosulfitoba
MTLSQRITDKRDDLIRLTQDLIRIPTLNPPGENYREICDFLDKRLTKHGFQTQLIRAHGTPGDSETYPRWNIVARRDGAQTGECVHFNSHTDVVEVGQGWTFDPFGGAVADGKIYGRGACDMKGGLAASIIAAEAFIEEHPNFQGAIEISGTADEESGGYGGVAYLAEQGFFDPNKVQHVIIPEPLQKDRICLGHRGGWWAEIETKGEIAHGSMPFLGDCAVRHMGAVLAEFETKLYPAMAARFTEMPVVPEGARQSTMNINSIHGGQKEQTDDFTGLPAHCVPDSCRIVIDRRYLVEETLDQVRDEVKALLEGLRETRPDFEYELTELNSVIPSMTDKSAPVVETVAKAIEDVMGKPPTYVASPGSYDQKHIDRIGKLKNCIAYGPGLLELAHKPDEYIGIDDMVDSAKVMGAALETLLLPKG